jgi:hypothetical protein
MPTRLCSDACCDRTFQVRSWREYHPSLSLAHDAGSHPTLPLLAPATPSSPPFRGKPHNHSPVCISVVCADSLASHPRP